jgi:hypothetical protein
MGVKVSQAVKKELKTRPPALETARVSFFAFSASLPD